MKTRNGDTEAAYGEIGRYYLPLALQAVSQSFTYPLVAIVATRGREGSLNIAALAQAHIILFFLLSLGAGLVTAGMVYCVNGEGLRRFRMLNRRFTLMIVAVHGLVCIPLVSHIIFSSIMGLEGELYRSTYLAFLLSLPFPMMFNFRNIAMVVLFNNKLTGKAFSATLGRIVLTVLLSIVLTFSGLTGIFWAAVCQTIPIVLEVILMNHFAKESLGKLRLKEGDCPPIGEMATLTFSFSAGKMMMAFSAYAVAGFAARAPEPGIMLPVYYAAVGIMNPLAFAASRMQATVISFAVRGVKNIRLFNFTVFSGLVCGAIPLVFTLPFLSDWYYGALQKIPSGDLPLVKQSAMLLVLVPFAVALRSYVEGWAAFRRNPVAVIAGQGVYLGAVVSAAFFAFNLGAQGNMIGPLALFVGNICAAGILALALRMKEPEDIHAPPAQFITPA